jgi:hypothetical protein
MRAGQVDATLSTVSQTVCVSVTCSAVAWVALLH